MKFGSIFKSLKIATKANSPKIKGIVAVCGIVGGTVWACKASFKAKGIVDEYKEDKTVIEAPDASGEELEDDIKHEMATRNLKLVKDLTLCYAGPAIVMGSSIALGINGFGELNKRYLGAVATAAGFQDALASYRMKVAKTIGEEKEADLYHGIEYKDVKITGEDGKEKVIKKAPVQTCNTFSPMVVPFIKYDANSGFGSHQYQIGRNDLNLAFLKNAQRQCNDILKSKDKNIMTLGEVLKVIGMEPTCLKDPTMAYTWGFTYEYGKDGVESDNYIDFGIWDAYWDYANSDALGYARQQARTLYLEFNARPLFKIDDSYENRLTEFLGEGNPEYDK